MARKRDIDPSLWEHVELASLPIADRYLFIGLFSNADDEGRLKGDPRYLKGLVFRYDDEVSVQQVREWRDQLVTNRHACVYEIGLDTFVHLPSWHRWQSINRRMPSQIPPCPEHGPCPKHEPAEYSAQAAILAADLNTPGGLTEHVVSVSSSNGNGALGHANQIDSERSLNGHGALTEHSGTTGTGPDRAGPLPEPESEPVPDRAGPQRSRKREPDPAPPPLTFVRFDRYLQGLKGYLPTEAFWAGAEQRWTGLDLDLEAAKILDWLGRHPDKLCSVRFLTTWLNRALVDQRRDVANVALIEARSSGQAASMPLRAGKFHKTCGTRHQDWERCPADTEEDEP